MQTAEHLARIGVGMREEEQVGTQAAHATGALVRQVGQLGDVRGPEGIKAARGGVLTGLERGGNMDK